MRKLREDADTARTIDVALVIRKLGKPDEARDHLRAARVAEDVIERVLSDATAQAGVRTAPSMLPPSRAGAEDEEPRPGFYSTTGRRRNVCTAAMVQAALSILGKLSADHAEQLLRREQVPDEVIRRVLSGDAVRRRPAQAVASPGMDEVSRRE